MPLGVRGGTEDEFLLVLRFEGFMDTVSLRDQAFTARPASVSLISSSRVSSWTSLTVQGLRLHASNARGAGLSLGQET